MKQSKPADQAEPVTEEVSAPPSSLCELASRLTVAVMGVPIVWTAGGDYSYSPVGLFVPGIESVLHELSHWLVATDSERRQENYGLCGDWRYGGDAFQRGVLREEEAFSLEFFLLGDPSIVEFGRLATCDANATCSPVGLTRSRMRSSRPPLLREHGDADEVWTTHAMLARTERVYEMRLVRGDSLRPDSCEQIRRRVLKRASAPGVPLRSIIELATRWRHRSGYSPSERTA